jgi:hypothetical protein
MITLPKLAMNGTLSVSVPAVGPVKLYEETAPNHGMKVTEKVKKCAP